MATRPPASLSKASPSFTEAHAWKPVAKGWQPLQGSFEHLGFSVEWHDFETSTALNWAPSFHPGGAEICLNFVGNARVSSGNQQLDLVDNSAGYYFQSGSQLAGTRTGPGRHQFLTIEFAPSFLSRAIDAKDSGVRPSLRHWLSGKNVVDVSLRTSLSHEQRRLASALRRPPVSSSARPLWYQAKALEIASTFLYEPAPAPELFCERFQRQNHERVEKVIDLLKENLAEAHSLEEIGRRVGCSQFHLSRIFSKQMGVGIFQYLRTLRMERAATLLREGRLNVTEVAIEVGYASPSHFSTAFHESFGCCPGLYPLKTLVRNA